MLLAAVFTTKTLLIAMGALLAYVFGTPLLILMTFRQQATPTIDHISDDTPLPNFVSDQFDEAQQVLKWEGFSLSDTLCLPKQTDNLFVILRLYTNEPARDSAIVVSMLALIEDEWSIVTQYCEFSTTYRDGSEFNTNNSAEVSAFKMPKNKTTTRAPWITSIRDLYRAHGLIMQYEAGGKEKELRLNTTFTGDAAAFLADGMGEELRTAANDGYIKLTADGHHYVPTISGAYKMAWPQLWPFQSFVVAGVERRSRELLDRVGFQEGCSGDEATP